MPPPYMRSLTANLLLQSSEPVLKNLLVFNPRTKPAIMSGTIGLKLIGFPK
jgi:hypothetical protein